MTPLDGIKVLDFTRYLPGPAATLVLQDFGAEVVKVEGGEGDPVRYFPPFREDGASAAYGALNGGKRSIRIDLKSDAGRELLLRLVEKADVLVDGNRPGVLDRLGLGHDACAARNPRLVTVGVSGWGDDGPYRDRAGHDLTYEALAGTLAENRDRVDAPVVPGVQVADVTGSLWAVIGVVLALFARERTGRGQRVEASIFDAAIAARAMQLVPALLGEPRALATQLLAGAAPCYQVYATRDGRFLAIGALEPKFWDRFCAAAGRPEWEGLGTRLDGDLALEVQALVAERTLAEWTALLDGKDACVEPVLEPQEVAGDAHVRARGLILRDDAGRPARVAPGVRLRSTPASPSAAVSRAGQDTAQVLERWLGLGPGDFESLRARGAFGAGSEGG